MQLIYLFNNLPSLLINTNSGNNEIPKLGDANMILLKFVDDLAIFFPLNKDKTDISE